MGARTANLRWRLLIPALFAAALMAATVSPIGPTAAAPQSADGSTTTTYFEWEAPKNLTGDLTVVLTLDADQSTGCRFEVKVSGQVDEDTPILLWVRALSQGDGGRIITEGRTWNPRRAQAHATDNVNTRPMTTLEDSYWTGNTGNTGLGTDWVGHRLNLTVAAFGLKHVPEAPFDRPFVLNLDCDGPVKLNRTAGRHARGFTHQTFTDNGAGAALEGVGGGDTMVYRDARINETFDNETVWFQAGMYSEEGDTTQGDLRLDHPNGSRAWSVPTGDEPADDTVIHLDDGPGRYLAELDLVNGPGTGGLPDHTHVMGILAGVDPVDSLDEVV